MNVIIPIEPRTDHGLSLAGGALATIIAITLLFTLLAVCVRPTPPTVTPDQPCEVAQ